MTLETLTDMGFIQAAVSQRFAKFEHHFAGVNKMVSTGHSKRLAETNDEALNEELEVLNAEARELEAKIAENVVELLETA